MKKNKTLLVLASLGLAGMLLAACTPKGGNTDSNTGSSQTLVYDNGAITLAKGTNLPAIAVNTTVDLDEYYSVLKDDNSTSKNYGIESTIDAKVLEIDGHKITPRKVGKYDIRLVTGDGGSKYVTVDCRSKMSIDFISLTNTLAESGGKNYTLERGQYTALTKAFKYSGTYMHNENYVGAYNKNNLGETYTDPDTKEESQNSFLLATLADGYSYFGYFDKKGVPTFENGHVNMSIYYIAMALSIDGSAFTSTTDQYGDEILTADATVEADFLHYGASSFPENYDGYSLTGIDVLSVDDLDGDGKVDSAVFQPRVYDASAKQEGIWSHYRLMNIGTSKEEVLEPIRTDMKFVPTPIVTTELSDGFAALATGKNYTIDLEIYPATEAGVLIPESQVDDSSAYTTFLKHKKKMKQTTTVTTDGIEAKFYEGDTLSEQDAFWNEKGQSYGAVYIPKTSSAAEQKTKELLDGVTDVHTSKLVNQYTAAAVTKLAIEGTNWKTRTEKDNVITWAGDVGNNDGSKVDNTFFQEVFDQFVAPSWNLTTLGTVRVGSLFSAAGMLSDGGSLTWASDYKGVTFDKSTGEIKVDAMLYLAFSDVSQRYIRATYTISNIGKTTNDFSAYANFGSAA